MLKIVYMSLAVLYLCRCCNLHYFGFTVQLVYDTCF